MDPADIPALMRAARGSYGHAVTEALIAAGYEDLPRNGPFVIGGMANQGGSAVDMIRGLGVSRQAASQLIDTLVVRGYLARDVNNEDRRRLDITLTERGRGAAAVIRGAVERIGAELASMITADELAGLRAGLTALANIKQRNRDAEI
ncbi:MAG TPA: MarR family transcriptional regulator [Pseudonocardiaceae bacterium]|jgi:DNA-binding MarR family transcriptional regulator